MEYICKTCGQSHDASEISLAAAAPVQWLLLTEEERAESELTDDLCVIQAEGRTSFYMRACLDVQILETDNPIFWGVWVSLSEKSFREMGEHWEDRERTKLGPYFGWLCTKIPEYPDTVFMKTKVHQRAVGLRPLVELETTEHPLSVDQKNGIDAARLQDIIAKVLHPEAGDCPDTECSR
jgi:hypothetical protein